MTTILVPCDGSENSLLGIRHVIAEIHRGGNLRLHLVNVQAPFTAHIGRHVSQEVQADFHREQAAEALAPARRLLDTEGVPYSVHVMMGDKASCICDAASRLHCDLIVIGTSRKSPLVRAVENSLTSKLIEQAQVPVEVIAGTSASTVERVGIPAGIGAGLAILWMGAA